MLKRIQFLAFYGLSWILFFQLFRIIFFLYHFKKSIDLGGGTTGPKCITWIKNGYFLFWLYPDGTYAASGGQQLKVEMVSEFLKMVQRHCRLFDGLTYHF